MEAQRRPMEVRGATRHVTPTCPAHIALPSSGDWLRDAQPSSSGLGPWPRQRPRHAALVERGTYMSSIERGQHNSIYPHKSPPPKRKEGAAGKSAGFTCVKPSLLLSDDITTFLSLTSVGSVRTRRGRFTGTEATAHSRGSEHDPPLPLRVPRSSLGIPPAYSRAA